MIEIIVVPPYSLESVHHVEVGAASLSHHILG